MAKVVSILPHDFDTSQLAEAIEKCSSRVPAFHWIQWIPHLTFSLLRKKGNNILGILLTVGKAHPQAARAQLFWEYAVIFLVKRR